MRVALCFFAIVSCAAALPAEVAFKTPDELDLSELILKNIYVEPVQPVKTKHHDLPGSRIIGGAELAPNSVPYQVAVIMDGTSLCGGSLISSTRVLSAAHCTITASFVQVRLGAHYFNQNEDTQVRITSTSIVNHEYYDSVTFVNDISIVLLPTAATLSDYIKVVPLAPSGDGSYDGEWGLLTGWGTTTDASSVAAPALRGVYLNVISNDACRSIYGDIVTDLVFCTTGYGIVGGCSGDSGGALVVDGVQVGIGSFQPVRCESGNPTGFTRVSAYRSWIAQNALV